MKSTIYGNRLPRGTQVKKVWEPLFSANDETLCYMHLLRQVSCEFFAFILYWEYKVTYCTRQPY